MMQAANDRLIPLAKVEDLAGYKRAYIYRLIRQGKFPAPYKPGGASSRWSEAEVNAWVAEVKAARTPAEAA